MNLDNLQNLDVEALLKRMTPEQMADMVVMLDELEARKRVALAQSDFLAFIAAIDRTYKFGVHLKRLGSLLMDVEADEEDRVAVSMAPRFGKSQMISIYYPAWYLGKHPDHKIIVASHTADLAIDMARKVRNLMQTAEYRAIFPDVQVAADAKAAGKWNTNKGGEYYAVGVGGALAGRGGNLIIVDDPISEQDIKNGNFDSLDTVYEWFRTGLRTRLMPEGKIVILHTRWAPRDLIGRLVKDSAMNEGGDQYNVFEFPAILNEGTEQEKSLWPEQWSLESLQRTKASMPLWQWNAQYMQNPTAAESAIIKREWIRWWPDERPPNIEFIIQSWDTALTTKARSDWSVCQTWGVFTYEEDKSTNLILLNSAKGKWEFPELKRMAHLQYEEWQPDSVIVEAKASGQPLIDEMRRSGIFVTDFSPGKGQDKIARLNAVSDMFSAGHVWFPETSWAQSVVEEVLAFPASEHDDEVDALTLALRRARTGGLLRLATDPADNEYSFNSRRKGAYTV
jgi:predicted phage terminase large subunit-like protein